jgi:hypothetical protein
VGCLSLVLLLSLSLSSSSSPDDYDDKDDDSTDDDNTLSKCVLLIMIPDRLIPARGGLVVVVDRLTDRPTTPGSQTPPAAALLSPCGEGIEELSG